MRIPGLELALERLPAPLPIWRAQRRCRRLAGRRARGRRCRADGSSRCGASIAAGSATAASPSARPMPLRRRAGLARPRAAGRCAGVSGPGAASFLAPRACSARPPTCSASSPIGARDTRPWLRPRRLAGRPLSAARATRPRTRPPRRERSIDYPFVRVDGDGVHEIPVGPVHAGIIEPGHFRFSVVGEKVLRLEERLGYTHKGIDKRFTELAPLDGASTRGTRLGRFDGRVCMGLLHGARVGRRLPVPARAQWLRALLLERERVANHLGDLGALGNDAALAFGLAQFLRLREDWLRLSKEVFGHRLMMDCVVPGGVGGRPRRSGRGADARAVRGDRCARCASCASIYDEHAGLQDRFIGTGHVTPELAARARPDRPRRPRERPGAPTCARPRLAAVRQPRRAHGDAPRRRRRGARRGALRRAVRVAAPDPRRS